MPVEDTLATNAVRPSADVLPFPIIARPVPGNPRAPVGEQVALTYRGETRVYETAEDLYAAFREQDPVTRDQLTRLAAGRAAIADITEEANAALKQAHADRIAAKAEREAATRGRDQAEKILRTMGGLFILAVVSAVAIVAFF